MEQFHSNGYGMVYFKVKKDIKNDGYDSEREPRFRKITAEERREIFINLVKKIKGKQFPYGKPPTI